MLPLWEGELRALRQHFILPIKIKTYVFLKEIIQKETDNFINDIEKNLAEKEAEILKV